MAQDDSGRLSRNMWPKPAHAALLAVAALMYGAPIAAAASTIKLVALGDSITAGLGLAPADTYPRRLEHALQAKGLQVTIANAGVSGDTAGDGLERLDWSVPDGTDGVILALGANDMLRGIDPAVTAGALERIVVRLQARHIGVLLVGMKAGSNLGDAYRIAYDRIFPDLAARHGIDFYPFLLQDVAFKPELNQADGMHPNAKGAAVIAAAMFDSISNWIARLGKN